MNSLLQKRKVRLRGLIPFLLFLIVMAEPNLVTYLTPDLILPTPVLASAGTFGFGIEAADLTDFSAFGALITPTLTLEPRAGNPPPRTEETSSGLLHATGLPNPGLKAFLTDYLPRLRDLPCPLIVSIWAETLEEWRELASALTEAGGIAALELNLCPPQLLFAERTSESFLLEQDISDAVVGASNATFLPVIAKLPPVGLDTMMICHMVETSADIVSVAQAFPGVAVRPQTGKFRFPGVVGGLSGPAIKPLALYQVWRAAQATSLPVIGGGGILTADDALEFFLTGATAVSVGLGNLISPDLIPRLVADLRALLAARNLPDLTSLIGSANR
jgi:dihydroorotate dehydrogenase (NAD+) catalytic subunit